MGRANTEGYGNYRVPAYQGLRLNPGESCPMKLQGILSSKGRRVAFERNQARRAPVDSRPMRGHTPTPHPDGSLACSGCGTMRYSPAAFAAHVNGGGPRDALNGIYTMGGADPWIAAQELEHQRQVAEDRDAEWRAEMVEGYYKQQRRRAPEVAEGVSTSITDEGA